MLNRLIRYLPIIEFLRKNKKVSICEFGSGSQGICEFIKKPIIGCDIDFGDYGKNKKINKNLTPVIGSVLNAPFKNNQFDLVIAVDMLEHLDNKEKAIAIKEMLRVSKKAVMVGFPCGQLVFKSEQRLAKFYQMKHKSIPGWLEEHLKLGFISQDEVESILKKIGHPYDVQGNENLVWHYWLMVGESFFIGKLISKTLSKLPHFISRRIFGFANSDPTYRLFFNINISKNEN